jgi:hypothetical protein
VLTIVAIALVATMIVALRSAAVSRPFESLVLPAGYLVTFVVAFLVGGPVVELAIRANFDWTLWLVRVLPLTKTARLKRQTLRYANKALGYVFDTLRLIQHSTLLLDVLEEEKRRGEAQLNLLRAHLDQYGKFQPPHTAAEFAKLEAKVNELSITVRDGRVRLAQSKAEAKASLAEYTPEVRKMRQEKKRVLSKDDETLLDEIMRFDR